uniref:Uncharacterized protein n=1 Tax=Chromera velia CCMP2878 TaxID=1169474 RepID=A0A0G4HM50_9ALVE|eukprot:Cvel_7439.t1-p1 / transcript=Cvel_7439.t1 / gene=Cvel_7439 / organism=Chromera_velia_CCMP2878 / gene_product=hypothetical protein / transcript_product=hypothetical protein / location=Cvel_scaffold388:92950-93371(+) / protein_length=106 / sequence_SO=supercontig / SO=protein_coding / is_pseudo=false
MARALCVLLAVFIQTSEAVRSRHSVKRIREASSTGSDDSAGVADLYRTLFSGFSPVAEEQREHQRKLWVQEAKAHVREERLQRRKAKRKALALLQKGDWGPIEAKK